MSKRRRTSSGPHQGRLRRTSSPLGLAPRAVATDQALIAGPLSFALEFVRTLVERLLGGKVGGHLSTPPHKLLREA